MLWVMRSLEDLRKHLSAREETAFKARAENKKRVDQSYDAGKAEGLRQAVELLDSYVQQMNAVEQGEFEIVVVYRVLVPGIDPEACTYHADNKETAERLIKGLKATGNCLSIRLYRRTLEEYTGFSSDGVEKKVPNVEEVG